MKRGPFKKSPFEYNFDDIESRSEGDDIESIEEDGTEIGEVKK